MSTPLEPIVERFRPSSLRRRLLVALLAVATAVAVVLTLLDPPGAAPRPRATHAAATAASAPAPCAEGQTSGCIGGKVDVIVPATVVPLAPAAR